MNCPDVTIGKALMMMPNPMFPTTGLRRDEEGNLTDDALKIITDGIKAQGADVTDPHNIKKFAEGSALSICTLNKEYTLLIGEIFRLAGEGKPVPNEYIEAAKFKNLSLRDSVIFTRHLFSLATTGSASTFIEGWQNTKVDENLAQRNLKESFQTLNSLSNDMEMLESGSYLEMRKHMVETTQEKNKVISNYLGMYGFLNLVAVGLLIYVAGSSS